MDTRGRTREILTGEIGHGGETTIVDVESTAATTSAWHAAWQVDGHWLACPGERVFCRLTARNVPRPRALHFEVVSMALFNAGREAMLTRWR